MDFISENFNTIMILAGILLIYFYLKMIKTTSVYEKERNDYIARKVNEIGGILIEIKKVQKSKCPFNEELGLSSDVVYVPYKVYYELENMRKEGWIILVISGSLLGYAVTDNNWINKLSN